MAAAPDRPGYIDDVTYPRTFFPFLAPAWLDHAALLSGWTPPGRESSFSYCDLGCGQGLTAVVLAATHPRGDFHGVDLAPGHIRRARRLANAARVTNVTFNAADFAADFDLPKFDYIVAHGVYSWIAPASQLALRQFIRRHLKPGGLLFLSYNAMPAWAADLPLQRLLFMLGRSFPGNSVTRYQYAARLVARLREARVPAITASPMLRALERYPRRFPDAYLAHEFMGASWRPLWFDEVRQAMQRLELTPAGTADLMDNYDEFALGGKARRLLARIADPDARELVREFFVGRRFRYDLFTRKGRRLSEAQQRRRLRESTFALARPVQGIRYRVATPAGRVNYRNAATRKVVDHLSSGPLRLADIPARSIAEARELLAGVLVLCAAGDVRPVESGFGMVDALNRFMLHAGGEAEPVDHIALPCGTAVQVDRALVRKLSRGDGISRVKYPGWEDFFTSHGVRDIACPLRSQPLR